MNTRLYGNVPQASVWRVSGPQYRIGAMSPPVRQFTLKRSLLFPAILVTGFFLLVEGVLRVVGVRPGPQPRLLLRMVDTDIELPFIQPDAETFWSPAPGFRGEF